MRKIPLSVSLRALLGAGLLLGAAMPAPAQAPAAAAETSFDQAAFARIVEQVRQRFDVPGIAVAIVKEGQVVLEQGWGVRELGKPDPVDAHTLFAIASNTKAFTAASLHMLAEEGKLDLDDYVVQHLPWFRLSDPHVTAQLRVRDLLTHRSGLGLGAGDLLIWPGTDYSTEDVVRRLAHVPLKYGLRERYAYDNVLYATAGLLVERVSGQSFASFLQQRFFDPLGMDGTRFNADALQPGDKVAIGHAKANFTRLQPTFPLTWHNGSGAGGLYSSVHDMARWMAVQLAGGRYTDAQGNGRQLFPEARQRQMWSLHSPMPVPQPAVAELAPSRPDFIGYGEGWITSSYRGEKLVWHTGGWPGMVSRVTLVPGRNLGVVVLTNAESGAAFNALTLHVLDQWLQPAESTDWVEAYARAGEKADARAAEAWARRLAARERKSRPSLPLQRYAGTYRDRWYGDIEIAQEGGRLRMRFAHTPLLQGTLEHWQHDSFLVRWDDRTLNGDAFVSFELDPDGGIRQARMEAASDLTDFSFDFHDLLLEPVAR